VDKMRVKNGVRRDRPMRISRSGLCGKKPFIFYVRQGKVIVKEKYVPEVKKNNCSRGGAGSVTASGCSVDVYDSTDLVVSSSLASCITTY
jgi:hypothetical protein